MVALTAIGAAISTLPAGMLTAHMLVHIAVMSILAPLCALTFLGFNRERNTHIYPRLSALLAPATLMQLTLFLAMHAPLFLNGAMHQASTRPIFILAFFAVSSLFWMSVIAAARGGRASSIAALLLTGKVFCLIAALMVLADRAVFGHGVALPDQHAAGLAMLVACPLTYVGASIVIVSKWLNAMTRAAPRAPA